jgi:UDP-N-acetylglucosamine 4-epimerase
MLIQHLKNFLSKYDPEINKVPVTYKEERKGDIPHSHASVDKAKKILGYIPLFNLEKGLELAVDWYWKNLK